MSPFETNFDYIILGAGSAGCTLAAMLAEHLPDDRILLLEAGDDIPPDHETVWDPAKWLLISRDRTLEWGYRSVAQPELNDREIQLGRAKALGGCSVHNAMVYVRGGAYGFDRWAQEGCVGWKYDEILPYFKRVEERMHVTQAEADPFIEDLVVACNDMGIPYNPNYNASPHAFGVSPFQFLISQGGRRETTFKSFLGTRRHTNLHITSGVRFDRILFDHERRAVAVEATDLRTQRQVEIHASREILVAAGAIGSPHLLLLSGVGPESQLRDLGIPVVSALPGVGENFQDDLFVTAMFLASKPMPKQPYGLMGAVIFTSTDPSTLPYLTDVECSLASGTMEGLELPPDKRQSYFIYPNLQLLRSRGTIKLASIHPAEHPMIDPRYLEAPEDIQRCIFCIKLARDIGHNQGLANWFAGEILPGPEVQTDAEIEAYIRRTADTCYHYAGTCKMGVDDMAVVTPHLEVRGTQRLRVVDASIIPTTVSGNTAAATMMIAVKGAELVLASRRSA
ncbi:GMC family oxidoreductase N-terminal domain-containing protein [Polyangium sp. y55x31]|uniref:GMC family oxidoreductase n=1 Tax=Polyangium sp. y55x31 TaxID=3042688 RepID=UPI0024824A81|nr:GMC family oxidoreductase N-terminal domain-containing protein [Polyangium sp. y55x31]MDI1475180.1 GMC family oxidoreductase N-terminal domain-containing protein [Polyangium sp. y55x31]